MISEYCKKLLIEHEGLNQPGKHPGGESGVTIGYGYDLGYVTKEQFIKDWSNYLPPNIGIPLTEAIGKTGKAAAELCKKFKNIVIDSESSMKVLLKSTLPLYEEKTKKAFPNCEKLPLNAYSALVSLVYNRGSSLTGNSRIEMLAIHNVLLTNKTENEKLKEIAKQLRLMKRLWVGRGLDGLLRRREDEAKLVESCLDES